MAYTLYTRTYGTPAAPLSNVQIDANFQNLYDDIQTRWLSADVTVTNTADKAVLRNENGDIYVQQANVATLVSTSNVTVGGDLLTGLTTFNLLNTTAETINFGGAATTISIGAATGTTTINNDLTVNGVFYVPNDFTLGNPGNEAGGIQINGSSLTPILKVSDIGGTKEALVVFHKHSTTNATAIYATHSHSDTNTHGNVPADTSLFEIHAAGWQSSSYRRFGLAKFMTSALGTLSSTSAPGKFQISLSPNGGTSPEVVLELDSDKSTKLKGAVTVSGSLKTTLTTQDVFNDTATTLNIGGAATTISLGASTGTTTVNHSVIVTGDLTVNGTTTTINSNIQTIDDPVFTLGGDTAPTVDDGKDRGIEYRWHNGSAAKLGFFGYDNSTGKFTFIPDATNTNEVFSGTKGTIDANLEWADILNKPSQATEDNFGTVQIGLDSGYTWATSGTADATVGGDTVKLIAGDGITLHVDSTNKAVRITNDDTVDPNTFTQSLTLTTEWQDTGIDGTDLQTGSYMVQITASDVESGGTHVNEIYTGVMSWYSGSTDSTVSDEVALHRAGAGPGSGAIFLRILREATIDGGQMLLQIIGTQNNTSAADYTFKFRKLI